MKNTKNIEHFFQKVVTRQVFQYLSQSVHSRRGLNTSIHQMSKLIQLPSFWIMFVAPTKHFHSHLPFHSI